MNERPDPSKVKPLIQRISKAFNAEEYVLPWEGAVKSDVAPWRSKLFRIYLADSVGLLGDVLIDVLIANVTGNEIRFDDADTGLRKILKSRNLRSLTLENSQITAEGLLSSGAAQHPHLRHLQISNCDWPQDVIERVTTEFQRLNPQLQLSW